jgi:hypothetical protein
LKFEMRFKKDVVLDVNMLIWKKWRFLLQSINLKMITCMSKWRHSVCAYPTHMRRDTYHFCWSVGLYHILQ